MATLTVQTITHAGLAPTLTAAAAGGDLFPNAGNTFLRIKNGHATLSRTVTVAAQFVGETDPQGRAKANKACVVPALSELWVDLGNRKAWANAAGNTLLTYSDAAADIQVAAVRFPRT